MEIKIPITQERIQHKTRKWEHHNKDSHWSKITQPNSRTVAIYLLIHWTQTKALSLVKGGGEVRDDTIKIRSHESDMYSRIVRSKPKPCDKKKSKGQVGPPLKKDVAVRWKERKDIRTLVTTKTSRLRIRAHYNLKYIERENMTARAIYVPI